MKIESIGFWNSNTVEQLSLKTGVAEDDLWKIIEAQSELETEHKPCYQTIINGRKRWARLMGVTSASV